MNREAKNPHDARRIEIISKLIPARRNLVHLMRDEATIGHEVSSADLERALDFLSGAITILNGANPCER